VAAINDGLSESELLIELKRAPLNGQCTGGSTGGRQLVDDSHAYPESGQPQGQHQARRTCANDEHLRWVGPVDLAHSGKSQGSARFRFGGFLFAISRGRVGLKRVEQLARRGLDFIDRAEESGFIGLGGSVKPAHLAHELQASRANLIVGHRRVEVEQGFDVAAHEAGNNPRRPL
jgi:hypothetical protein